MAGIKGHLVGARPGAGPKLKPKLPGFDDPKPRGHPKGVPGGGHDGRQPGATNKSVLAPARVIPTAVKWNFAEYVLSHG